LNGGGGVLHNTAPKASDKKIIKNDVNCVVMLELFVEKNIVQKSGD